MEQKQVVYWASTGILCVAMLGGGTADLLRLEIVRADLLNLGYPEYLLTILGVAKWSAAATIAAPNFPRLKEWAYAGVAIDLTGATISHIPYRRWRSGVLDREAAHRVDDCDDVVSLETGRTSPRGMTLRRRSNERAQLLVTRSETWKSRVGQQS